MLFWCLLLTVYIILSYFIDARDLNEIFRHLWNFIPFTLGMYLIYRTKMKQRVGYLEKLENRVGELADRYESLKYGSLFEKVQSLEARITELEKKITQDVAKLMLTIAYCLVSISLLKIILDLSNPELYSVLSFTLDNIIFFVLLFLILRISFLKRRGSREYLKKKLTSLEKDINEIKDEN